MMLTVGENGVHRPSCVTVVYFFVEKNENTHSLHVIIKWWREEVGVGEPTVGGGAD